MIFLTIGSHEPFDRLVSAVDHWCSTTNANVFGQITNRGSYKPSHFPSTDFVNSIKYRDLCSRADILVAHAGMGSIITALEFAKPIVILPRRAHLKEMRNDHQYATAQQFSGKKGIFVALDESALPAEIEQALKFSSIASGDPCSPFADRKLIDFLSQQFVN